jgi:hypothetical protein
MAAKGKIQLRVSEGDDGVAYLQLPDHPGTLSGVVKKTIHLGDVVDGYLGPDIHLDFDSNDVLIGIEIVV